MFSMSALVEELFEGGAIQEGGGGGELLTDVIISFLTQQNSYQSVAKLKPMVKEYVTPCTC